MVFEKPIGNKDFHPRVTKEEWIKNRTEFLVSQGFGLDDARERAVEEAGSSKKEVRGMHWDLPTGEVMKKETFDKIKKEMRDKGATEERPSTNYQ